MILVLVFGFLFLEGRVYCQFDNSTGIPACASNCSYTAFTDIGCTVTANTTTESCSSGDLETTSDWFTAKCATVDIVPPSFTQILDGQLPPPPPPPPPAHPSESNVISTVYSVSSVTPTTQVITTIAPSSTSTAEASSQSSSTPTATSISGGAIGGIVVGGSVAIAAVLLGIILLIRRTKRKRFLRPRLLEMAAIGEDEPKSPALRYPSPDLSRESYYGANLSSDTRGSTNAVINTSQDLIEEVQ